MKLLALTSITVFVFVFPILLIPSFAATDLETQNDAEHSQDSKLLVFLFESSAILNVDNTELDNSTIYAGNNYVPIIVKITGQISESEFFRGLPVHLLVIKPDDISELLKIIPNKEGYFETLLTFDRDSMKGDYRIQLIYHDKTDQSMDIFFSVA